MKQATGSAMPYLGFGLRLRKEYLAPVLRQTPAADWFEIITENYLDDAASIDQLLQIRQHYPIVMHGMSLAIGSPWPLDLNYLDRLRMLMAQIDPSWVSDHLCWSGADDIQGNLLPLPYSRDMIEHLVPRIQQTQEILGRQILLENVPMEQVEGGPGIPEAEFIAEVAERSDSLILLDIANLHASGINRSIDTDAYLAQLPTARVQQIHLAGAVALCEPENDKGDVESDPVWAFYTRTLDRLGPVSTMIERVDTIPSLDELVQELAIARCAARSFLSRD